MYLIPLRTVHHLWPVKINREDDSAIKPVDRINSRNTIVKELERIKWGMALSLPRHRNHDKPADDKKQIDTGNTIKEIFREEMFIVAIFTLDMHQVRKNHQQNGKGAEGLNIEYLSINQ